MIRQQQDRAKRLWQPCKLLRFYFLAISVKKNTSATEIRGDSRAKKSRATLSVNEVNLKRCVATLFLAILQ